jgi:hypothetical protein
MSQKILQRTPKQTSAGEALLFLQIFGWNSPHVLSQARAIPKVTEIFKQSRYFAKPMRAYFRR